MLGMIIVSKLATTTSINSEVRKMAQDELLNGINKMVDESVKETPTTTLKLKDSSNMKQIDLPQKESDGVGNPIKKGLGDSVSKIRNEQMQNYKKITKR